jgi:hypothetical protein
MKQVFYNNWKRKRKYEQFDYNINKPKNKWEINKCVNENKCKFSPVMVILVTMDDFYFLLFACFSELSTITIYCYDNKENLL